MAPRRPTLQAIGRSTGGALPQLPGDCNQDGRINLADAISALGFLFLGGPPHALARDPAGQSCIPIAGCLSNRVCP